MSFHFLKLKRMLAAEDRGFATRAAGFANAPPARAGVAPGPRGWVLAWGDAGAAACAGAASFEGSHRIFEERFPALICAEFRGLGIERRELREPRWEAGVLKV